MGGDREQGSVWVKSAQMGPYWVLSCRSSGEMKGALTGQLIGTGQLVVLTVSLCDLGLLITF